MTNVSWPYVHLLWITVYSIPLPIFNWIVCPLVAQLGINLKDVSLGYDKLAERNEQSQTLAIGGSLTIVTWRCAETGGTRQEGEAGARSDGLYGG